MVKIKIVHELNEFNTMDNGSVDVWVETNEGTCYILEISTPQHMEAVMKEDQLNYVRPGCPRVIVKQITKEIVEEAAQAYAEVNRGCWLKAHHFSHHMDKNIFETLRAKEQEKNKGKD